MCNNVLELAGNPSTAFTETDLSPDPYYNFENSLPDWLIRRRKRQQKLAEILKWYQDLHWGWKLGVGIGLLIGAITLTAFSGGGWLGALGVVAQVAIGVGVAVGLYSLGALFGFYDFSLEGLGNVALDAFLASSAIVFVSSGVGFIKYVARNKTIATIHGKAHGSVEHQNRINIEVERMQSSGKYSDIYLNKSLKTAGLKGNQRPDIIGKLKNGRFEAYEIASKTQTTTSYAGKMLRVKMTLMKINNPTVNFKNIIWLFG